MLIVVKKKNNNFEFQFFSMIRFPKANTWFQNQTETSLATYAQNIHDGLLASIATFPTPPVLPAALQTLIDNYSAALALATGPGAGKINTANKNSTKVLLVNALRQDAQYVNQIIVGLIGGGTIDYTAAGALIISSGYQLSKDPVPAGPLPNVVFKKYGSFVKGQYYILLEKVVNAKGYAVKIVDNTAGTGVEMSFPNVRITITGLISGHEYTFSVAAIGASPERSFGSQLTGQFII